MTSPGNLLAKEIDDLARRVVEENAAIGRKIVVAESCTGGLVSAARRKFPVRLPYLIAAL